MAVMAAAGIAGGASLLGGVIGGGASKSAASTQAAAAQQAAQLQYSMYQQTAGRLAPWVQTGQAAQQQLGGLLGLSGYQASGVGGMGTGSLVQPFQPTMAQLSQTPGYQFTMQQGLEATQAGATSMGQGGGVMPGGNLGVSGPEGKGMANYAENLASTTYQQQFQNYWNQLNNIYNMYSGTSSAGANAAAGVGQAGTSTAVSMGNALQSGAASQAAGTLGAANALGGSLSSIGSIAMSYPMISAMQNFMSPTVSSSGGQNSPAFDTG